MRDAFPLRMDGKHKASYVHLDWKIIYICLKIWKVGITRMYKPFFWQTKHFSSILNWLPFSNAFLYLHQLNCNFKEHMNISSLITWDMRRRFQKFNLANSLKIRSSISHISKVKSQLKLKFGIQHLLIIKNHVAHYLNPNSRAQKWENFSLFLPSLFRLFICITPSYSLYYITPPVYSNLRKNVECNKISPFE